MEQTTTLQSRSANIESLGVLDLEHVTGGKDKEVKWDFTIKASTSTDGKSTVEASVTFHF